MAIVSRDSSPRLKAGAPSQQNGGFTQYVYARFGIQLPHPSGMQATIGTPVTDPQPGDLMANAGHAGIYIGNGLMIHAMNPVDGTKVTAVMPGMGYYRLLG